MFFSNLKKELAEKEKTIKAMCRDEKDTMEIMKRKTARIDELQRKMDALEYGRKYYPGEVYSQEENGILSDPENIREIAEISQSPRFQFVLYDFREKWLSDKTRDPRDTMGGLAAIDQLKRLLISYAIAHSILADAKEGVAE